MKTILCTVYNSLYLDKGLVLYDSLKNCCSDFSLYVLCMDDKCYEVLSDINADYMIPIRLRDFEDDELLKVKSTRSFGEYCWTCTPSIILYIIEKYKEPICTYIDADMYFYKDPQILIDEMISAGKSVMIIPHRFTKVNKELEVNGIYCVEFNTFVHQDDSMEVLKKWRVDCLECCTSENDGFHYGDQKYMDSWPESYECVYVCPNLGAGVAPWNIQSYKLIDDNNGDIKLISRKTKIIVDLVFYHFQHIVFISESLVNINIYANKIYIEKQLVNLLYKDYLKRIRKRKEFLKRQYNIKDYMKNHITDTIISKPSLFCRIKRFSFFKLIKKLFFLYNKDNDIISIPVE